MMQQIARIPDTQLYGMQSKHALTCCWCGALLTEDMDFQARHMQKEHGLEC